MTMLVQIPILLRKPIADLNTENCRMLKSKTLNKDLSELLV